jgi:hypothetical protein
VESWPRGRLLLITVTKRRGPFQGAVFETAETHALMVAQAPDDADSKAAAAGTEAQVFAVRPY